MKVTVIEKAPAEKTLEITVASDVVDNAYDREFKKVRRQLAIPGFRRGKVPAQLARKYITDEGLTRDVLEALVPKAYRDALEQENLTPLSEPNWDLVQTERGKELVFKVTFEVTPVVEIDGYEGMEITQERPEITGEEVEKTLDNLRRSYASIVPVEDKRGLQQGDLALVDYTSRDGDRPMDGGSAQNYLMELEPDQYLDGFLDNLYGLEPGQDQEFESTFPEDYENPDMAGKTITFNFQLKEIKRRELPEADDEFARTVSDHQTVEELRSGIREQLVQRIESQSQQQAAAKVLSKLLEQVPAEKVPQSLHTHRTNIEMRRLLRELAEHGTDLDAWLQRRGLSKEQWLAEVSAIAMFEARIEMVVAGVAAREELFVPPEEVDKIIASEAASRRIKPAKLRATMMDQGSLTMLKYSLLRAKVHELLVEKAAVSYILPGEASAPEEAAEEPEEKKTKAKEEASKAEQAPKLKRASKEKSPATKKAGGPGKAKSTPKSKASKGSEEKKGKAAAKPKKKAGAKTKKKAKE